MFTRQPPLARQVRLDTQGGTGVSPVLPQGTGETPVLPERTARPFHLGGFLTLLAALGILLAGLSGCGTANGGHGKSGLWQQLPGGSESRRERESLKKAVEKDPFPRAKSSPVDLDA